MLSRLTAVPQNNGARFRITVPEDRQRNIHPAPRRPARQTHGIRQNYRHRRPTSLDHSPTSTTITADLAVNVCQYINKRPATATSSGTPGSGPSQRPASLHPNFALLSLDSMSFSIQPRDLDAKELLSVSHRALVVMNMSDLVYVGHSGATNNYSRREAFASIRQALYRVVPFDNNHPVSFSETGTPTRSAFSALSTRGVMD
ncbi:hypothetical protein BASA83_008349 [Batrachochytrium salamandrivorans]|nr:hypothetical protein BASA83_008349 [Batrachochytrium salamandrivorans]